MNWLYRKPSPRLLTFAPQAEVRHYVRTQTVSEELARLAQILQAWRDVQSRVANVIQREAGIAETIKVTQIPEQHIPKIENFAGDKLFQKTFSQLPTGFAMGRD